MAADSQNKIVRWFVLIIVAFVIIVFVGVAVAMTSGNNSTNTDYDYGMMGSWGGAWWLMMIVPIGIVVLVALFLVIALADHPSGQAPLAQSYPTQFYPQYGPPLTSEPLAILDRRLASGEITIEEHARLKEELARR